MQDVFIEYMVKKRRTPAVMLAKLGIALGGGMLSLAAFSFSSLLGPFGFLGVVIAFGAVYGAYLLITGFNIEYEYTLTNGEMDVDKILAQKRRKRLISIKLREVEDFGQYKAAEQASRNYQQKIFACDDPTGGDLWFASVHHKDKGATLLVFNANEKMLGAAKPFLPRPIFHRAFQNRF
ncbi:MAG: hypothetical protein FWH02_00755 [Oscillospiraceae bacterium]|nr:hypothetical protein [Oscillospiraceae bacterium]